MSSGIRFNEVYTDPESDINNMTVTVPPMSYVSPFYCDRAWL